MSDLQLLKKGDIVNFDMIRPGIFGAQYKAALITGIVDYNTARIIDPDTYTKHQAFYFFFKDKVDNVNNPEIYNYLVLQLDPTKADRIVIGFPWVDKDSVKTIQSRYAQIIIQNFQEYQRAPLLDFLNGIGSSYVLTVNDQ